MSDTTWMARGACRDVDPELFFPTAERGPLREAQTVAAKRVCAACPVRAACLAFALDALPDGVAGGFSAAERRTMRRDRTQNRGDDRNGRDRGVGGVA